MNLSNTWYDRLKWIQMILLPAVATAILALNVYWDIPNQDRIVGTIGVVAVFLGALLRKNANDYQGAGDLVVHYDRADGTASLATDLNEDPASWADGTNVVMNVKRINHAA